MPSPQWRNDGQTLHVTEGIGRIQSRGGEVTEIHPGAAPDHFMTHIAMWESPGEGQESEWGAQE